MILEQDEEVLAELCQHFTPEQKEALLQSIDLILKNIDLESAFGQKK